MRSAKSIPAKSFPQHNRLLSLFFLASCMIASAQSAFADYASGGTTTLGTPLVPGAMQAEPRQTPQPGPDPPPGSGANPLPLTTGDAGAPPPPPTAQVDRTTGSRFGTQPERVPTPVQFNGTLGRSQDRSYPYPEYRLDGPTQKRVTRNGQIISTGVSSKKIWRDSPGAGRPQYQPLRTADSWQTMEDTSSPMPTVKIFCRILVIAGAVFGTVFMIFAAFAVILGHKDAGHRVIGTAAGLIFLFMGYSIYKIVMINAFRYPSAPATNITQTAGRPLQNLQPADTPVVPANPPGTPRANLPVLPFYNARQPR